MSDAMARISALAQLLRQQQAEVERLEAELAAAKAAARRTETEDLPQLMTELELTEIKLLDGSRVSVVQDVLCGISEENRPEAHAWLVAHGFGGLIKTNITLAYGRDERERAAEDAAKLREWGLEPELKEGVHFQTLKAFIKEQLVAGSPVPTDLFGVLPFDRAKLTAARSR